MIQNKFCSNFATYYANRTNRNSRTLKSCLHFAGLSNSDLRRVLRDRLHSVLKSDDRRDDGLRDFRSSHTVSCGYEM